MAEDKFMQIAAIFYEGVEGIQSALSVAAESDYKVHFSYGNCGKWTIEFIPDKVKLDQVSMWINGSMRR